MKRHNKTFLVSIVTFAVGASCCWLSSLAIWLGGGAFLGTVVSFIENVQTQLIAVAMFLMFISLVFYWQQKSWLAGLWKWVGVCVHQGVNGFLWIVGNWYQGL